MNKIDFFIIKILCTTEIDVNTDPLKYVTNADTEIKDVYLKGFFQNVYQLFATVFIAGAVLTLLISFVKYLSAKNGPGRKESQMAIIYKGLVIAGFFALVAMFNIVLAAIKGLPK